MTKSIYALLLLMVSTCGAQQAGLVGPNVDLLSSSKPSGTISTNTLKNYSLANAATADVLPTVTGSGYISELALFSNQSAIQITVTVDGESTPSIQMNLADLLGDRYLDSQPTFTNNWISGSNSGIGNPGGVFRLPIPFSSSIHITMTNNSGSTALITGYVVTHTGVPDTWPYTQHLYAVNANTSGISANAETNMLNVTPGKNWRLAGIGWIYDAFPGSVSPKPNPLEGAFKIYQDGALSITSSGSEDFFGLGWYFNHGNVFGNSSTNILSPLNGDMSCTIGCVNSTTNNTWGAQRFFIRDPITGSNALKVSWVCGNTTAASFTGTCTLISTVYYYTQN